jgi:hypothetical protein
MSNKNKLKILVFVFSFFLLFSVFQVSIQGNAVNLYENQIQKLDQSDPPPPLFNVPPGTELVYNITDALSADLNQYNVTQYDEFDQMDHQIGAFVPNEQFVFRFEYEMVEPESDPPNVTGFFGEIQGQGFDRNFRFNVTYKQINQTLNNTEGLPLTYFVIPADINFTKSKLEFEAINFSVADLSDSFAVDFSNSTLELYAQWNKTTGILIDYYYNFTDPLNSTANVTLGFKLILHFDPGKYMPYFGYDDPLLFYSFEQLRLGDNNFIDLEPPMDSTMDIMYDSYGFFEEGQIAEVDLDVWQGDQYGPPGYEGFIKTKTGGTFYYGPFGPGPECPPDDPNCEPPPPNSKTMQENPPPDQGPFFVPFLAFLFPTSTNDGWFQDFSVFFEAQSKGSSFNYNETHFELFMQDPYNPDMNITATYEKSTGLLVHYEMYLGMPDPNNNFIPFNLELSLYSSYDLALLQPSWGINEGDQFKYSIDALLTENGTKTEVTHGYFEEGQEIHIRFDELNLIDGPYVSVTVQTTTGKTQDVLSFENKEGGWPLLMPILPLDTDGILWSVFEDVFGGVYQSTIINDAQIFSVESTETIFDNLEMKLFISWNKSNGLLSKYSFTLTDLNDGSVKAKFSLTFLGQSSGDVYVAPDDESSSPGITNTPGFEIIPLFVSLVIVAKYLRKEKEI